MGFFDRICEMVDTVREAAERALEEARRLAAEAARRIREAVEEAERVVEGVKHNIERTAEGMTEDLKRLTPNLDEKLEEIINEVTMLASEAAEEGVDITDAINAAVATAIKKVEEALNAAIDAVNRFLREAKTTLFAFLKDILPQSLQFLLTPLEAAADFAVSGLETFGQKLKEGISKVLKKIKDVVQGLVKKVGEVLGPIWQWIKKIWKTLFGEEPEQCELTRQWFEERMRRTEAQFTCDRPDRTVNTVIRKRTYLELAPPSETAWKDIALEFVNRQHNPHAWRFCKEQIVPLLSATNPKPGSVVHLTWDEPFTDQLGGRQRIQTSIIFFRWRTEDFREVSSGFVGVLSMLSAEGSIAPINMLPAMEPHREQPLQMDASTVKEIYDELAKSMPRLDQRASDDGAQKMVGSRKKISRQLKYRDDDGVWRVVSE